METNAGPRGTDRRGRWWIHAFPVGLAIALPSVTIATRSFDGLYGQDAYAYLSYAHEVSRSARQITLPGAFGFPIGYPLLVALASGLTEAPPWFAQAVSILAAAGTVAVTYLLARELLGDSAGAVFAATVVAASGQLWLWSSVVMADTTALFWATLAAFAVVRYRRTIRPGWLVLASGALAMAVTTRWIYALLLLPVGAVWLSLARRTEVRRQALLHLALGALVALVLVTPEAVVLIRRPEPLVRQEWLTSWSPANVVRRDFDTSDGHAHYSLPPLVFYAKAMASPRSLFPLLTPFFLVGLVEAVRRKRWLVLMLAGGWGAAVYGFLIGIPYENFRFTAALLPPLGIFTALGARWAWDRSTDVRRAVLMGALLVGLIGGVWYSAGVVGELVDAKDADLAVARWVQATVPPGGRVLAFGITLTLDRYTSLEVEDVFPLAPDQVAATVAGRASYLVLAVDDVESQWVGRSPDLAYRRLRDGPGLDNLGTLGRYTLFRVRA